MYLKKSILKNILHHNLKHELNVCLILWYKMFFLSIFYLKIHQNIFLKIIFIFIINT